jgi:hypothetical protein
MTAGRTARNLAAHVPRTLLILCTALGALLIASPAIARPTPAGKALMRALKHNPRLALKATFLRKAAAGGVDLPLTFRLSRRTNNAGGEEAANDTVHFSFDQFAGGPVLGGQPPIDPPGAYVPSTTLSLTGSYTAIAHFGADTSGYGKPSIVEITQGQTASLASPSSTTLLLGVSDPGCSDAQLVTIPSWGFAPGGVTDGTLDLFGGDYTGTLRLKATVSATCGGSTWQTVAGAPVLPLALSGRFRLSPALTADGRVRLGTIAVADPGPSDTGTHAELHLHCAACAPADLTFTGRLKALAVTAEVLIGA